jgi:hypothetical protein
MSREVFDATANNVAEFAATGDAMALSFSDEQRDRVGDHYTRRRLDPKAKPVPPVRPKATSSVDDFAL